MSKAEERTSKQSKGRPKARNPLSYVINIRITKADGQRLEALAENLQRDRAEMIRSMLLEGLSKLEKSSVNFQLPTSVPADPLERWTTNGRPNGRPRS